MRKIMADIVSDSSQFIETPNADQKLIKIPEPGSSNSGKCGVVGVGEIVRSRQSMDVEIEASGNFLSYFREKGSRFKIKLDYLKDSAEDEVTDTNNYMGEERGVVPQYAQQLEQIPPTNTVPHYSIRMIKLEKWIKSSATEGVIGLMGVLYKTVGNDVGIQIFKMSEYYDKSGDDYIWQHVTNLGFDVTSAEEPDFDFVEMADGSLLLVLTLDDGATTDIYCYRSFDMGNLWIENSSLDKTGVGLTSATWYVAVERIGSRVVVIFSDADAGGINIYSQYSDDFGISWSDKITIVSGYAGAASYANLDCKVGQDGILYVSATYASGFVVYESSDGLNFDLDGVNTLTLVTPKRSNALLQTYYGRWECYITEGNGGYDTIKHYVSEGENTLNFPTSGSDKGPVNDGMCDAGGMGSNAFAVEQFNNGAFRDLAIITHDSEGTDYYTVTVIRLAMWSGLQLDETANGYFDICWFPYCYPSNDGDPDTNYWTRILAGTGAVALSSDGDLGHLRTSADTTDEAKYYRALANTSWDNGVVIRFEVKNSSAAEGFAKVEVNLGSVGNNKDVKFSFIIRHGANEDFVLFDENAAAVVSSYVPTETGFDGMMDDWNEYVIVAKENEVQIYRAPSGAYRDVQPYERLFNATTLQEDAYVGNERITWGVIVGAAQNPTATSLVDWRSMMYKITSDMQDWDFDTDVNGKKCHTNPCGIMQGFGCKFVGEWALDGDTWDLVIGAQYQGENIFVDSPRRMYKEPVQSAANPDRVFTWEREDVDDQEMQYSFNAIAILNTNCFQFKLEGENFGGGGAVTLFDSEGTERANILHSGALAVSAIDKNVITLGYGTSNWNVEMIPGQYASNDFRQWFVYMIDGVKTGQVYKVLNNSGTKLFVERSAEEDGVAAADTFYLYSDRFFHIFSSSYDYARLTLTIQNSGIIYLPDNQARLGTVVIGRTYDLPDDDWQATYKTMPNTSIVQSRGGLKQVKELGQEQRSIDLRYVKLTDRGMGIEDVRELYRLCRWGVRPLVWIDHDEILDGTIANMAHGEPILVRASGNLSQNRASYNYLEQNGNWHIRNFLEAGINLDEVL